MNTRFDVRNVRAEDLEHLDEVEFRKVVDADIRRADSNSPPLRPGVSEALRSDRIVPRWHATITQMARGIDAQLAARGDDYERAKAEINKDLLQVEEKLRAQPDDSKLQAQHTALRLSLEDLKIDHLQRRAGTLRFRNRVDETIVEARTLRERLRDGMYDSIVSKERNHYAERVRRLEAAITRHQEVVLVDLDGDEPDEIDQTLWAALAD